MLPCGRRVASHLDALRRLALPSQSNSTEFALRGSDGRAAWGAQPESTAHVDRAGGQHVSPGKKLCRLAGAPAGRPAQAPTSTATTACGCRARCLPPPRTGFILPNGLVQMCRLGVCTAKLNRREKCIEKLLLNIFTVLFTIASRTLPFLSFQSSYRSSAAVPVTLAQDRGTDVRARQA